MTDSYFTVISSIVVTAALKFFFKDTRSTLQPLTSECATNLNTTIPCPLIFLHVKCEQLLLIPNIYTSKANVILNTPSSIKMYVIIFSFFLLLHQPTAHNVHCTGTFVKMQVKIYGWKRDFEETQTTRPLWPSLPPCVNRSAQTCSRFQFAGAGIIYLDVNNCARLAQCNTPAELLLWLDDSSLSAQPSSTPHSLKAPRLR